MADSTENPFATPSSDSVDARWSVMLAAPCAAVVICALCGAESGLILEWMRPVGGRLARESMLVAAVIGVVVAPVYLLWLGVVTRWRPTSAALWETGGLVLVGTGLGGLAGALISGGHLRPTYWGMRIGGVLAVCGAALVAGTERWTATPS